MEEHLSLRKYNELLDFLTYFPRERELELYTEKILYYIGFESIYETW